MCNKEKCLFYKDKKCIIPSNKNFNISKDGIVYSCINYITKLTDVNKKVIKKYNLKRRCNYE